jgi:hypothetical protein
VGSDIPHMIAEHSRLFTPACGLAATTGPSRYLKGHDLLTVTGQFKLGSVYSWDELFHHVPRFDSDRHPTELHH